MEPIRRSTRMSAADGIGKEPTGTSARQVPRTSREMRAATAAGVRRRSQAVSLGLSHEELFGDAAEPPVTAPPAIAEDPSPPPADLAPAAEISGVVPAGPVAATARAATSMGTAVPEKAGTPMAVIAAAVAGGLVFVAVAFYWFVIRDASPVASAPSAEIAEIKGRVLVQTKELDPAEVYIDGTRRGTTAKGELVVSLPMGPHDVRVMIGERQLCAETVQVVDPAKLAAVLCQAAEVPPAPNAPAADAAAAEAPPADAPAKPL